MQTPRNHLRAFVKRIETFGMLSVVLFTVVVATGLAGGVVAHASTQTYTMTDLGTLGYNTTFGNGINANGQIAGTSYLQQTVPVQGCPPRHPCHANVSHAFLYGAGKMTDIGTLGGTFSSADAVNSTGEVTGTSTLSGIAFAPTHAFLYHNGTMTDLGTLGGSCSFAYGMNDFGEVVGQACTTSNQDAFLYSGGKMTDLGTLGNIGSEAVGINNSHQVVGTSEAANGSGSHAVMWNSNGKITDLGTLGGLESSAYAINNAGQVVGYASPPTGSVHAFLYSGGKMINLGVFFDSSVADAINSSGVVVGTADVLLSNGNTEEHAFIYSNGKLQDLNNLIPPDSGWVLTSATGINDKGQIVCNADNGSGGLHAFLLNPN
jgi:probable HAF family extracellular repeat protein